MGVAEHVLEPGPVDPGAEQLDRLLAQRARGMADDIGLFLRLAIGITCAVGDVHARGLIHKDIKPANICWTRRPPARG